jgi:dTDP-4-dehydrorhamnose 3,5-epimerase
VKYTPSDVAGVTIIDIEPHRDDRGCFSRAFCANEFAPYGLISNVAQTTISYNYAGALCGSAPPDAAVPRSQAGALRPRRNCRRCR